MRIGLCMVAAPVTLADCGPSPATVAKFNAQNAALWTCASQQGVTPPLTIAQKYRAGGATRQIVLEVVPDQRVSAHTAGQINVCIRNATPPEPGPDVVTFFFNSVFVNATPDNLGKRVPLKQTNDYLLQAEQRFGSASAIAVVPAGEPVRGTPGGIKPVSTAKNTPAVQRGARPNTSGSACPKHASVLYGGTSYCIGN